MRNWAKEAQPHHSSGLQAGLVCAAEHYVVAWLLWDPDAEDTDPLEHLAGKTEPWLNAVADNYSLPAGLWDAWPGINLSAGQSCLNIPLSRPKNG